MIKHLSKKMISVLGTASVIASLGMNIQAVKADTVDDANSSLQTQLDDHKNLQAYKNPLVMERLTTKINVLPEAQAGVANWSTLPAGTTAVWNMKPDVASIGTHYGQIIVTFPDGSASALAVYVDTTKVAEVANPGKATENNDSSNQSHSTETNNSYKNNSESGKTSSSVITSQTVKPVSTKAIANKNVASKVSNINEIKLPQSHVKANKAAVVAGLLLVGALSIGVVLKNKKVKENN